MQYGEEEFLAHNANRFCNDLSKSMNAGLFSFSIFGYLCKIDNFIKEMHPSIFILRIFMILF